MDRKMSPKSQENKAGNPAFLQIPLLQVTGNTRHIKGGWVFHRGLPNRAELRRPVTAIGAHDRMSARLIKSFRCSRILEWEIRKRSNCQMRVLPMVVAN